MKKFISLILFLLPFFASAQFTKGQIYLGGSLSLGVNNQNYAISPTQSTSQTKNSSFSIAPTVGHFLTSNVAIGASLGYAYSYGESDWPNGFQNSKTNSITSNLFTRYYIPISKSFYFVAQGRINFNRNSSSDALQNGNLQDASSRDSYSVGLSINPIFIFFPSPKWGIEGSIGSLDYSYSRELPNASGNSFGLSAGSLTFGLAYYFGRKEIE